MGLDPASSKEKNYFTLLAFLFSAMTAFIGLLLWFTIRETLMITLTFLSFNHWKLSAVDNFSFVILGIGWLILVYFSFYYYKKGFKEGLGWSKILLLTGVQSLLFFTCKITMISTGLVTGITNILVAAAECFVGIGFIYYAKRRNKERNTDIHLPS